MTKQLRQLTAIESSMLVAVRDEWLAIGLSTLPTDRAGAYQGVCSAYEAAGLLPPKHQLWLASPLQGSIAYALMPYVHGQVLDQVRDQVQAQAGSQAWTQAWDQVQAQAGSQAWTQAWDQVQAQIRAQAGSQIWAQVREQIGSQIWSQVQAQAGSQAWYQVGSQIWAQVRTRLRAQVGAQAWTQVWTQVGSQAWDQVQAQVLAQIRDQIWAQVLNQALIVCYGLHDAGWLSLYDAFIRLGLDEPKRLMGHMQVARCSGWWWPFSNTVIMTERPIVLVRDDRHRLHCETGPAISYSDGWGIWAWHGVRVSQQVIEAPQTLSASDITIERNAEIRRVMIERFGQERYIRESGAKLVHRDDWGTLWRTKLAGDEDLVMVQVTNSTPEPDGTFKDYWLRVPPAMRHAHEAVAWTFEQKADDYLPTVQT